jgi:hypothetical protein
MQAAAEPRLSERISGEFLEWARGYDDPGFAGRNHRRQEDWLASLPCPVIRLDSATPVRRLVEEVGGLRPDAPAASGYDGSLTPAD